MRALVRFGWGALLAGGLLLAAPAPAMAWGSYSHVWIAERAYGVLVSQHPWLAAHRDAFLWGAITGDLDLAPDLHRPTHARTHSPAALQTLWKEACASDDQGAQAFAMGWAVHMGADETCQDVCGPGQRQEAVRQALNALGTPAPPANLTPLIEWAVDAQLVPRANGTVFSLYRSTVMNVGTPAGGPLRRILERVLDIDESTYLSWARLQAAMSAGNTDRYLAERSHWARIEPWSEHLRSPSVRQALGNIQPEMTRAVDNGVKRARAVCLLPAQAEPAKPAPAKSTPAKTAPAKPAPAKPAPAARP